MEPLQQQKTPQKASYGSRSSVSDAAISRPSRTIVHAKLEMTEPGGHDELEADAAANDIVSGSKIRRKISNGGGSGIAISPQMESQIAQLQGGGHAMPAGLRNMMENGFGRDFSQVRLHTDSQAADMSSSISARAFTHGNDIYFNRGQFSPNTSEGQRLVAHELTHVAQGTGKIGRDVFGNEIMSIPGEKNATYDWLRNTVLSPVTQTQLAKDLKEKDLKEGERTLINIVIYTTRRAACNGKDYNTDPRCSEPFEGEEINNFVKNTENRNKNENIKTKLLTFVLYGNEHLKDYVQEMRELVMKYGPLQNLVISGHGNWNGPDIGTKESFSFFWENSNEVMSFYNEVRDLMFTSEGANVSSTHSIVFDECLVGVGLGDHNYADKVYGIVSGGKYPLRVFANLSSTSSSIKNNPDEKNAEISYNEDGELTYINHNDSTTVCISDASSICGNRAASYKGNEINGYLAEIWRQCNNLNNHIDNRDLFSNSNGKHSSVKDDNDPLFVENGPNNYYKLQRNGQDLTEKGLVNFVNEKILIINSTRKSKEERTKTRRKLKELINYIYTNLASTPKATNSIVQNDIDVVFNNITTYTHRHLSDFND